MAQKPPDMTALLTGHVRCSPGEATIRAVITGGRAAGKVVGISLDDDVVIALLAGLANAGAAWGDVMHAIADESITGRAGTASHLDALSKAGKTALERHGRSSRAAANLSAGGRA